MQNQATILSQLLLCSSATLLCACANDGASEGATIPDVTSGELSTVAVEIDYEEGAEPYTGNYLTTGAAFSLFGDNLDRLFQNTDVELSFPTTLDEMENIGPLDNNDGFTSGDILALAEANRDTTSSATTQGYYVVFVDGLFNDGEAVQEGILGVSLGDTGVIAMFKPVIEGLGILEATRAFGEQAVLTHEFGHAIGLVNRGVPALSDHHDEENGAHCTNTECVMYHQNEGAAELVGFIEGAITRGDRVLFDADCLADYDAFLPR